MDEETIRSILHATGELADCPPALVQAALDAGAPDNVTVVWARWDG